MKKVIPKSKGEGRGGKREGAGRKLGTATKEKITIAVDADALSSAMERWKGTRSGLFNGLLLGYIGGKFKLAPES